MDIRGFKTGKAQIFFYYNIIHENIRYSFKCSLLFSQWPIYINMHVVMELTQRMEYWHRANSSSAHRRAAKLERSEMPFRTYHMFACWCCVNVKCDAGVRMSPFRKTLHVRRKPMFFRSEVQLLRNSRVDREFTRTYASNIDWSVQLWHE